MSGYKPETEAVLFSASEEYFAAAAQEIRTEFPDTQIERLTSELGLATGLTATALAQVCRERPLVFVRHLVQQQAVLTAPTSAEVSAVLREIVPSQAGHVSLQVWSPDSRFPLSVGGLRAAVEEDLLASGIDVRRGEAETVLAVCVTREAVRLGVTATKDVLADWPGGRVSLKKTPQQISRSEFKLEELLKLCAGAVGKGTWALDLGASPGGWTRLLRARGYQVCAVDPASLDPALKADPGVHHVARTAGRFLRETQQQYDLVVNDMRMDTARSAGIMNEAVSLLAPQGRGIVTLKTGTRDPLENAACGLSLLRQKYKIVFARSLFHNRAEVTVVVQSWQS